MFWRALYIGSRRKMKDMDTKRVTTKCKTAALVCQTCCISSLLMVASIDGHLPLLAACHCSLLLLLKIVIVLTWQINSLSYIQACQKTCYQRHVIKQCGCSDAYYPADNASAFDYVTVPVCSVTNITQGSVFLRYG